MGDVAQSIAPQTIAAEAVKAAIPVAQTLPPVDEQLPVYLINLSKVALQYNRWVSLFPNVKPYFAIKCFPDTEIIKTLRDLGANFDCASAGEIDRALNLNIAPERIIFANPCKIPAHIKHAKEVGVHRMTADSQEEMDKIARVYPGSGVLLRIVVCDKDSKLPFSSKFGADEDIVEPILRHCLSLPITIEGVSFHVGSGGCTAETFREAVSHGIQIVKLARELGHAHANVLDIGGGFVDNDSIVEVARGVEAGMAGCPKDIEFMSEPGRWFCGGCLTLAAPVIATRFRRGRHSVHLSEGAYGMFSNVVWDKQEIETIIPMGKETAPKLEEPADLWGPSCDSMDFIVKNIRLPRMEVGDWVVFPTMGAYTYVSATEFNGFKRGRIIYADDLSFLQTLRKADV
ncbi:putative Ornithine decarboxylase [Paratrimastix pyriformis]|uniref:ornithine decarboxylase n=1 Tax=Paratrimastix pyriformis TaxID=342808 RepID=A0ABQ8UPN6_9EUKA|nr:putative Ornithine decarboxylase [Paratrimastix pyriformis]|eukprot:GAFH01001564.1.p2 GENE.GAFH01001564.1~~GAFH01001564.1.p2  ORF type:complete len:412 (-),score=131.15 GAFH01001564.1:315-1517(-)